MSRTNSESNSHLCCAIELTETVENYLKAIFALSSGGVQAAGGEAASTSRIAERLGVAPPSASSMISRLRDHGLVEQVSWGHVGLSAHGREHARRVVRRHRLLETFLHQVLGLGWDEIHAEAEVLEHRLSAHVEDLIDAALNFPERDPHGDPIPGKTGVHIERDESPLRSAARGDRFLVERVSDHDSAALRRLARLAIGPGVELDIERLPPGAATVHVRTAGQEHALDATLVDIISGRVMMPVGSAQVSA